MSEAGARVLYEFNDFRLDPQQRLLLTGGGEPVPLAPKIFDTLLYFIERRGELLDKATLLKAVWPNVVVEENSLNQNISALRRALKEHPGEHRFIVTEPGRGYRFVADVRAVSGADSHATPATATVIRAPSVAVLPFANLTSDPDKEYFGDGMAEELIHMLTRVPGLKVPARTSSFAYKGRNVDVRQIANDLAVGMILEGSVRSAGARIRVTAQLIDAATGYHLWSQSYDRDFEDLFSLQDELAGAIVAALKLSLSESLPVPAPPTEDVQAYQLYLQGHLLTFQLTLRSLTRAMQLFAEALERDERFARAHAGMAMARILHVAFGFPLIDALAHAQRDAERALALDPRLAEPHVVLGSVNSATARWIEAEEHYALAISLDPRDPMTRNGHAIDIIDSLGHTRRGAAEGLRAWQLAPAVPALAMAQAVQYTVAGLDAQALFYADLAADLGFSREAGPMSDVYASLAARAGNYPEAIEHTVRALGERQRADGGAEVARLVYEALRDRADSTLAIAAVDEFVSRLHPQDLGTIAWRRIMLWYALLGALEAAHDVADRSLDHFAQSGSIGLNWGMLWMPELLAFRRHPRFQKLAARLGFFKYWEQFGAPDNCELRDGKLICH